MKLSTIKLIQKTLTLALLLLIFNIGCKKLDTNLEISSSVFTNSNKIFYAVSSNTTHIAKKVILKMKESKISDEFLYHFIKDNGIPNWDKIVIQKKAKQVSNFTASANTPAFDTIIIVPFVRANEHRVNGFIKIQLCDTIRYNYSLAQDYKNYPYNINQTDISAESFSALMMSLDKEVFGYKKFIINDSLLFRNYNLPLNQGTTVFLQDSTYSNTPQNLNSIYECQGTQTYISWSCNARGNTTSSINPNLCGVSFQYNTCKLTGVDWGSVFGGGGTGGGSATGGGGSAGAFIPYNFPCNPNILVVNNITAPQSGTGVPLPPCPQPIGGIGWVPVLTQNQLDNIWMTQHVKDSTNNPCDSLVLATIKNMDTSLPRLFRNVFGNNPEINVTFKTNNLGDSAGASTKQDLLIPTKFEIAFNSYHTNATTLSKAASVLHEALHANLMFLFQKAVYENNIYYQNQIINDFKLFFDSVKITSNPNLNYTLMMNQGQNGQHQIMTFENIRIAMAKTLLSFAKKLDPNSKVDLDYCKKIAWAGTFDSRGYKRLPQFEKDEIEDIINGERGNSLNQSTFSQIGKPCP